jgi:tripartite-type tricarboxylate transporter receptor subunit TctC
MIDRTVKLGALAAAALAASAIATPASAFLDGKTVTVIVPSGSGGTFHLYGQLVQRHIGKHLPGKPNVVVQNRPGAGGVKAANYMAQAAPKDGTVIAEINPGSVIIPLMRKVRFDPRSLNWIGTVSVRTYTMAVWHDVAADTIGKHKKTQVIMGASGVGSTNFQLPTFLNHVIGTKYKIIKGYKGGGAINLAMARGEVQGRGNYYSGYLGAKPHWIREKKVKIFATIGPVRPEVKDVPRLRDLVKGEMNQKMLGLLEVGFNIGQAFYLPPGTPKARVDTIRKAFTAMLQDKAMLAEAARRKVPVNSRTWEDNEKVVNAAFGVDKTVSDNLSKILGFDKKRKKKKKK